MNVLQLSKYYPPRKGGIETVAAQFSRAHQALGDQNYIISFGDQEAFYTGNFQEKVTQIKQDFFIASTPISFNFHRKILEYIKVNNIEIIYVHLPNPYMHQLLYYLRSEIKIPIIGIYHSDIVNQKYLGPIYMSYFKATSNLYHKIICSSENLKKSSTYLQKYKEKVYCIPFPVDGHVAPILRTKGQGKFLYVGRLVPYKGLEFLIKAFKKIPYDLTIIGDGPLKSKIEVCASKNVHLLGEVSEEQKQEYFNSCDALILSSINNSEAYGMVLAEALERGMPVVAPNIPTGVTFLARHNETGLIFDVLSEEKLIFCLNEIQQNQDLYSELSKKARHFYEINLTPEVFAKKLDQVIKEKKS
jgi:rhamnosyl/mannosyltransferase